MAYLVSAGVSRCQPVSADNTDLSLAQHVSTTREANTGRRREFTDRHVRDLKKPGLHADPRTVNLFVRVQPSGVKSYVTVAREPGGRQRWTTLGRTDHMKIDDARAASVEIVGRIKQGLPAKEAKPDTLAVVAENWLAPHSRLGALQVTLQRLAAPCRARLVY